MSALQGQKGRKAEGEASPRRPLSRTNSLEELRRKRHHSEASHPHEPTVHTPSTNRSLITPFQADIPFNYSGTFDALSDGLPPQWIDENLKLNDPLLKMQRQGTMDKSDSRCLGTTQWPSLVGWEGPEWIWLSHPVVQHRTEGFPSPFAMEMGPLRSLGEVQKQDARQAPIIRGMPIKNIRRKDPLYRTPTIPPGIRSEMMKMPSGLNMDVRLRSSSVGSTPCRHMCHWPIPARVVTPEGVSVVQPSMMYSRRDEFEVTSRRLHPNNKRGIQVDSLTRMRQSVTEANLKKEHSLRAAPRHESSGRTTFADLVHAQLVRTGHQKWTVGHETNIVVTVKPEGSILYKGTEYHSISSFALAVIRERNPGRRSCDGWKEVKYEGLRLETVRERYLSRSLKL